MKMKIKIDNNSNLLVKKISLENKVLTIEGTLSRTNLSRKEKYNEDLKFYCVEEEKNENSKDIKIIKTLNNIEPFYLKIMEKDKKILKNIIKNSIKSSFKSFFIKKTDNNGYPKSEEEINNYINLYIKDFSNSISHYYTSDSIDKIELVIWYLKVNDFCLEKQIEKYFRVYFKQKLGNASKYLELYNDLILLNIEKMVEDGIIKIPYFIGSFNYIGEGTTFYKYLLESPKLTIKNNSINIIFQNYYKSENFVLYGTTYKNKKLSELKKEDLNVRVIENIKTDDIDHIKEKSKILIDYFYQEALDKVNEYLEKNIIDKFF